MYSRHRGRTIAERQTSDERRSERIAGLAAALIVAAIVSLLHWLWLVLT